eukprot:4074474-Prymnesium_polylepis.2
MDLGAHRLNCITTFDGDENRHPYSSDFQRGIWVGIFARGSRWVEAAVRARCCTAACSHAGSTRWATMGRGTADATPLACGRCSVRNRATRAATWDSAPA